MKIEKTIKHISIQLEAADFVQVSTDGKSLYLGRGAYSEPVEIRGLTYEHKLHLLQNLARCLLLKEPEAESETKE